MDTDGPTKDVPKGSWVDISNDSKRLVAHGPDVPTVIADSKAKVEESPIFTRVPETDAASIL